MENFWIEFVQALALLVSVIVSNTAVVEAFKNLISLLVSRFPNLENFKLKDRGSFVAAAIVAYIVSYFVNQDFVSLLGLSEYLSPELAQVITWALTFLLSNKFYDRFIKKAQG